MLSCRDVTEIVSDGKEIAWYRRPGLWFHLSICGACRLYLKQITFIKTMAKKISRKYADPKSEKELEEKILKKI